MNWPGTARFRNGERNEENSKESQENSYIWHRKNNMAHIKVGPDNVNELKSEAVVKGLNRVIVYAYEPSCPVKAISSSRNVA